MKTVKDVSCYTCKHYHSHQESGSWEYVHVCRAHPTVSNLRQFPFRHTQCPQHERGSK